MKWTYGTKWLTYDIIHSFEQTQFIWFIPQYDTLYSCGSLLPNLRADINLEVPKVLKVLSVMLSILMIFFVLQHCYAIGEFWLVPQLRKGSIIWAQFYFWYFASTVFWWSSKYHPSICVWRIVNIICDNFAWIAFVVCWQFLFKRLSLRNKRTYNVLDRGLNRCLGGKQLQKW